MAHPFLHNLRSFSIYVATWIAITAIHFLFLYLFYSIPIWFALIDSITFNMVFMVVGLPLWYVVRYTSPQKKNISNMILNHLASGALLVAVWFGICQGILTTLFEEKKAFMGFLNSSIPFRIATGILYYLLLGLAYYLIVLYSDLQNRIKKEARLNELLRESELNMLKSQINPHFLFNSLNSISSLAITDPMKAREMVIRLSDFLRYSVTPNTDRFVVLSQEMENISRYLEIEKVRFGKRLEYSNHFDPACEKVKIPAMLLQPLFENAVKHGVYESTETVRIESDCTPKDEFVQITIANDFDPEAPKRKGAGLGLNNIRERLRLIYFRNDLIQFGVENKRFKVILKIPYDVQGSDH